MKCPNCNVENTGDSRFCIKCGTELAAASDNKFCMKCGASLKASAKFCTKCGTPTTPVNDTIENKEPAQAPKIQPYGQEAPKATAQAPVQTPVQKPAPQQAQAPKPEPQNTSSAAPAGTPYSSNTSGNAAKAQNGYASLSPSYESMKKESAEPAAPQPAPQAPKAAGFTAFLQSSKGLILIIALVIVALLVAILLVLKSFGAFSGSGKDKEDKPSKPETTVTEETDPEEDDSEPAIDPAKQAEIDKIKAEIQTYVEAAESDNSMSGYYPGALDRYITLAEDYGIAEDIQDEAKEVFDKYVEQTRYSISLLNKQAVMSSLYTQARFDYDEVLEYSDKLNAAGIAVNSDEIREESDGLIDLYREKYIDAINEITERENWSRDEAWNLANNAASIVDDDGNMVLFDLEDYDDPLRLRYIYCLAWATRKEVENGVASGSLTAEEALDIIDSTLEETDYNPQLIFDAISYCNAGGIDPSPYKVAFDSFMDRVCDSDGIVLVLTPGDAEDNRIDINHYWYFNDISSDAESKYQVNGTNGSTSETRAWIRENIRINRIDD